jgi:1-acyl-sn-glycerol-3-phosphate acyltransferase
MDELDARFAQLKKDIAAAQVSSLTECNNNTRRKLYSRLELLRLDYEESFPAESTAATNCKDSAEEDKDKDKGKGKSLTSHGSMSNMSAGITTALATVFGEMDTIGKSLRLVPLYSSRTAAGGSSPLGTLWRVVDIVIRFVAVCLGFTTIGAFLSLPVIALQYIDNHILLPMGAVTCYTQYSERIRRWIGDTFLLLSGIFVTVEGLEHDYTSRDYINRALAAQQLQLQEGPSASPSVSGHTRHAFCVDSTHSCSMLTFSHASNIDGFLICKTCPIRHYALAKKELFVTPLFSWISLAVGGVPIDRNHRERAINALKRSTQAVLSSGAAGSKTSGRPNQACIVIAPEGTRSTTGQLLAFKKGPFYMWEQLKVRRLDEMSCAVLCCAVL